MHPAPRTRTARTARTALTLSACLVVAVLSGCANTAPGGGSGGSGGSESPSESPGPVSPEREKLVGSWLVDPALALPTAPYLTILADGTWTGSDGCNGVKGTWELSADGELITVAGPSTLIYCEGKPLPKLWDEAVSASVDGDALTLTGADGAVTATLVAGQEPLTPVAG